MLNTTPRTATALGAAFAAVVIGLAASTPADAATRISFGALVPAPPIYTIDTTASVSSCPIPDTDAHITSAYRPQWLDLVAAQSNHASAQIQLDLDSVGNLMAASVVSSSGNALLDGQALAAARGSLYAPEVRNCNSFKRSYFVNIAFDNPMVGLPATSGSSTRQPVK
jgi:TonB family protein